MLFIFAVYTGSIIEKYLILKEEFIMMTALSVVVSVVLAMVFVMAPLSGDAACLVLMAFLLSLVFLAASSQYDCH